MMDSLSRWILDYYSHPPKHSSHPGDWQLFQLGTDDGTMWWDLRKTTPEEALKAIRRYYATGDMMLDQYAGSAITDVSGWDESLSGRRDRSRDGSGRCIKEDTEMDKKRFDRLLDYAEKRRDDPDASDADIRYWAGYIDGLRAMMKGSGGDESLSEIEALRRLR